MKLCRFGQPGQEKPGLVSEDGTIRDLSGVVDDITVETLARARAADPATLPVVEGTPRYGVPVNGIGKIVAIGLNYEDHAIESNLPIPTEPMMFMKAVSSLNGPNDPVMLPQDASHGDWEVELGVIIGRTCRYVSEDEALGRVAGYVLANDVSERGGVFGGERNRVHLVTAEGVEDWPDMSKTEVADELLRRAGAYLAASRESV